ncbi:MAG: M67 family metallopeptidase [Isosphaeraceae bacterium]|jgi:proteasome lid subunit RPN8/RPN11
MMAEANAGPDAGGENVLPLEIPADLHGAMIAHCRRDDPLECCGILGGVPPRVLSLHPLRNIAASKTRYTADPKELIQALVWLREQHREILAIYHSHPRWEAVPSATDLTRNYWGEMPRIIVSMLADPPDVRVWRLRPDSFQELPWELIGSTGEPAGALQPMPPRG